MSSAPVKNWTINDVSNWLRQITLGKYAELFAKHEINGEILLTMNEKDLTAPPLNITTFGVIRKFGIEIENLKSKKYHPPILLEAAISSLADQSFFEPPSTLPILTGTASSEQVFKTNGYASAIGDCNEKHHFDDTPTSFRTRSTVDVPPLPTDAPENYSADDVSSQAVMIKGTALDRALEMEDLFADFCWRYQTNVDLVKQLNNDNGIDAEVVVALSPSEFYVQPILVADKAQQLLTTMNAFYTDDMEPVPADRIYETMPCAVFYREEPGWFRAIVHEKGAEDARVVFVDWGNSQFTKYADIKPLTRDFGRFPPLAVHCRIEGVRERSLEQVVVRQFLNEMESLQMLVKIVPVSFTDKVVNVHLLHPKTKTDIGVKYLPKDPLYPPDFDVDFEEKLRLTETLQVEETNNLPIPEYNRHDPKIVEQMKVKAEKLDKGLYASDMEAFFDGAPGFDEVDSDDEDFKPRNKKLKQYKRQILLKSQGKAPINEKETLYNVMGVEYVRDYPKQAKPPRGAVTVFVAKVISAREVYLRSDIQTNCLNNMKSLLDTLLDGDECISLPEDLLRSGTACAYKCDDGRWYRAKIGETDPCDPMIPLILVDYARIETVRRSDRIKIKALRAHSYLLNEFQIYKCKIYKLCDPPLTSVETELLNELLIENEKYTAYFEREREPYRVHLESLETMKDFTEVFENEMAERDLDQKAARQRNSRFDIDVHRPTLYNQQKFDDVTAKYDRANFVAAAFDESNVVPKVIAVKKCLPSPPTNYSPCSRFLKAPVLPKRSTIDDDADPEEDGPDVEVISEDNTDED